MADKTNSQSRVARPPQTTFTALLPARGRVLMRPPAAGPPRGPELLPARARGGEGPLPGQASALAPRDTKLPRQTP